MVGGFEKCLHFIIVPFTLLRMDEYSRKSRAEVGHWESRSLFTFNLNKLLFKQRQ